MLESDRGCFVGDYILGSGKLASEGNEDAASLLRVTHINPQ